MYFHPSPELEIRISLKNNFSNQRLKISLISVNTHACLIKKNMAGKNKERSINPVLAMRKNLRKREIKKTKQTRKLQRNAILKQKDANELIAEMENLDKIEVESIRKGYFNENTLREKKHKIRQTIIQLISLYENENKDKAKEIKTLLSNYDLRKSNQSHIEEPSNQDQVQQQIDDIKRLLPNIPLPPSIGNNSLDSQSTSVSKIENSNHNSNLLDSINMPSQLNDQSFQAQDEALNFPKVAWLPVNLKPAPPPPFPPPPDAPLLPEHLKNAVCHYSLPQTTHTVNIQPGIPPSSIIPSSCFTDRQTIISNMSTISVDSNSSLQIDPNANYNEKSTLFAKPILKDLQAEVTKFIPTTLKMKRTKISNITPSTDTSTSYNKSDTNDKLFENFMNEINDLSQR